MKGTIAKECWVSDADAIGEFTGVDRRDRIGAYEAPSVAVCGAVATIAPMSVPTTAASAPLLAPNEAVSAGAPDISAGTMLEDVDVMMYAIEIQLNLINKQI